MAQKTSSGSTADSNTAKATSGAAAVEVFSVADVGSNRNIELVNEGPSGFVSLNNGNDYIRFPASSFLRRENVQITRVLIKRDATTAVDMSGVYGHVW